MNRNKVNAEGWRRRLLPKLSKLKPNRKFPMEVFYKQCLSLCSWESKKQITFLTLELKHRLCVPLSNRQNILQWNDSRQSSETVQKECAWGAGGGNDIFEFIKDSLY